MGGFLSTTKTVWHKSYAQYNAGSSKWKDNEVYYQFEIRVTVAVDGTVSYTITSTNNVKSAMNVSYSHCKVAAWVEIAGETVVAQNNYTADGFPRTLNSTKSGTLANKVTTDSITIKTKILPASDWNSNADHTEKFNNSLITSTLVRTKWTNVGVGTVTITDNGNNTFNISGEIGADGTNNEAESYALSWGYDSEASCTNTVNNPNSLTCNSSNPNSRWVYAKCITTGTQGDKAEVTTNSQIKRYAKPSDPGKPVLDNSSLKNNRLTVKKNWKYTWSAATPGTSNSPVLGYRIRIFKVINGTPTALTGLSLDPNNTDKIIKDPRNTNNYVDRLGTSTTIEFNPLDFGFQPGQEVQVSVIAWAKNGAGTVLWCPDASNTSIYDRKCSDPTLVQNAGVVLVKHNNEWVEGQVLVKQDNTWVEAEAVLVMQNGSWQESTS